MARHCDVPAVYSSSCAEPQMAEIGVPREIHADEGIADCHGFSGPP